MANGGKVAFVWRGTKIVGVAGHMIMYLNVHEKVNISFLVKREFMTSED